MAKKLETGDKAPEFTLPADDGKEISLSGFKGKKIVLYFYPKDDTPGCTKEACSFRDSLKSFNKMNAQVIGISKDSVKAHGKFRDKYSLTFPLVSDEDGKICEKYGTWIEKSMYGRKYMGIDRATFLIDEKGIIRNIWRGVKVTGHAEDVMETIAALQAKAA